MQRLGVLPRIGSKKEDPLHRVESKEEFIVRRRCCVNLPLVCILHFRSVRNDDEIEMIDDESEDAGYDDA